MVDQYYSKRIHLFKIPYRLLLAYHSPIGNTIKLWTSPYMMSHIIGIRNNLHILNTAFTIIQIRKALNSIYHRVYSRGSLLIYAQAFKALKISHGAVYTFVTSWLPGLISNYAQIAGTLSFHRKVFSVYGSVFFTRPQLDAMSVSVTNSNLGISHAILKRRLTRFARVPSVSFSVLDGAVWLNECHNLGIPSIQICDTQSLYDQVTYPIVSNQRSVPFTYLLINLFSEICNYAVVSEHLHFTKFNPSEDVLCQFGNPFIASDLLLEKPNYHSLYYSINENYLFKYKGSNSFIKNTTVYKHITSNHFDTVNRKPVYVFNSRLYKYQIKDLIKQRDQIKFDSHQYNSYTNISTDILYYLNLVRKSYRAYLHLKNSLPYNIYQHRYKHLFHETYDELKTLFKTFVTKQSYPRSYFQHVFQEHHLKRAIILQLGYAYKDLTKADQMFFTAKRLSIRYIRFSRITRKNPWYYTPPDRESIYDEYGRFVALKRGQVG